MIVVRPGVAVAECGRDFSLDTHRLIRAPGRHDAPSCAHREQRHRILVRDGSELDSVIAALAREPNSGVIAMPDSFTIAYRLEIISLADRYRLPAVYPFRFFAEVGGLLSYGVDLVDNYRRVATYVDRILKGENPSELPVQAPVKFELVINLKTAKALGLTIPDKLLALADEVIE